MKHRTTTVLLISGMLFAGGSAQASVCKDIELEKKAPVPFVPFELQNPETGERYLPNEEIEIGPDKKMLAGDFFKQLNETEQKLNRSGYSLRDEEVSSLGKIDECLGFLSKQSKLIDASVSTDLSDWNVKDQLGKVKETWDRFKASLPDWDTMQAKADSEKVKVYLPPIPKYSPPVPEFTRLKAPELNKSRSWSTEFGQKSKFWGGLSASYKIQASKTKAKAQADGSFRASVLGKWEGEVVGAHANASVFQNNAASLSIGVDMIGRSVYSKSWKKEGLRKEDKLEYTVDKGVDARFSIGPIPARVRVGFAGAIGLKYGYEIVPIQIGAYAVPFAGTRAYAQAGVDIWLAGVGVGGDLILIEDDLTLKGVAGVTFAKEPKLVLELSGTNRLRALSGELYLYAYINYLFGKWKGRFGLWSWKGITHTGEIFRFRTEWTPRGMIAQGDVQPEDLLQVSQQNLLVDREEKVKALETQAINRANVVFSSLRADLESDQTNELFQQIQRIKSVDANLDEALQAYWAEVREWSNSKQG